jgi:hypothetical protein
MRATRVFVVFVFCLSLKLTVAAVTVGSCQSIKHSYQTISAAIAAAPPHSVINICPGTYAEQIEIDKPLTLRGILGTVTIIAPDAGINELPAGSRVYPQVLVNKARGEVKLTNIIIDGSFALFNAAGFQADLDVFCVDNVIQNAPGVYFLDTDGVLEGMTISNQFGSSFLPEDFGPQVIPNCGSGVEFYGSRKAVVRNSNITNVGFYGIYSNGDLTADHNVVLGGFGPHGVGISAVSGTISDNTVTGSTGFYQTIGIQGGDVVRDNNVQSAIYGIAGAPTIRSNTLVNNAIGLSGVTDVSDNQISSNSPIYYDPGCFNQGCDGTPTGPAFPTIGVDFACVGGDSVRNNSVQGEGIGFANVPTGTKVPKTNTFSNVTTVSTSCSH